MSEAEHRRIDSTDRAESTERTQSPDRMGATGRTTDATAPSESADRTGATDRTDASDRTEPKDRMEPTGAPHPSTDPASLDSGRAGAAATDSPSAERYPSDSHPTAGVAIDPATLPAIGDVRAAAARLKGVAERTRLFRSEGLSSATGVAVYIKDEGLQRSGSFKLRGGYNAVALLSDDERGRGVVTASAGNHGLGVAIASRLLGVKATIYVPAAAPKIKRDRIAAEGAELHLVNGTYDDAHAEAEREALRSGRLFVHAFSDPRVVAGAGTVGLEIVEDLPDVRTVIVPVGGGGLIGGVGTAVKAMAPGATVIGVQSEETSAMHASLLAGHAVLPPMGETLCDGLSGEIDERSLALAQRVVDRMVLVSEAAVARAMRWLHVEHAIAVEGSGAVAVAAVLEGALGTVDGPAAVIVSGSNVDAARLEAVLAAG